MGAVFSHGTEAQELRDAPAEVEARAAQRETVNPTVA